MASESEERESGVARKLIVPAVISLAGSAAGLLLTQRQKVREAAPRLREAVSEGGVGELTGDLRDKLDEVLGRDSAGEGDHDTDDGFMGASEIDWSEYEERRRARRERRDRRRQRSRR
jgi:hypothetical protein